MSYVQRHGPFDCNCGLWFRVPGEDHPRTCPWHPDGPSPVSDFAKRVTALLRAEADYLHGQTERAEDGAAILRRVADAVEAAARKP